MFQSIFLLPGRTWGKLIFCISPVQLNSCAAALFSTKIKSVIFRCWLLAGEGCIILSFRSIMLELAGHEEEFWPIISLFLFWVNYHVIVVCWIIFSQKRNYSDNKQLMSFVGMKVRYDDKTILYVKTFPGIWTIAVLQISQYFFLFPLSIKHFCHQSS